MTTRVPKNAELFDINGVKIYLKRLKRIAYAYEGTTGILLTPFDERWDNEKILDYCARRSHIVKDYFDEKS